MPEQVITNQATVELEQDDWGDIYLWIRPTRPGRFEGKLRIVGPLKVSDIDPKLLKKFIDRWNPPTPELWRLFNGNHNH